MFHCLPGLVSCCGSLVCSFFRLCSMASGFSSCPPWVPLVHPCPSPKLLESEGQTQAKQRKQWGSGGKLQREPQKLPPDLGKLSRNLRETFHMLGREEPRMSSRNAAMEPWVWDFKVDLRSFVFRPGWIWHLFNVGSPLTLEVPFNVETVDLPLGCGFNVGKGI